MERGYLNGEEALNGEGAFKWSERISKVYLSSTMEGTPIREST